MSAPVDVLAVLDQAAYDLHDYRSGVAWQPMDEARATVAELIEVAEVANSVLVGMDAGELNHHHVAELRRLLARPATRAALARCNGGAA